MITRRMTLAGAAIAGTALLPISGVRALSATGDGAAAAGKMRTRFAPAVNAFRALGGDDPVDRIAFAADAGFTAMEDNPLKQRPVREQERIGRALADHDMTMGVFVATTMNWNNHDIVAAPPKLTDGGADGLDAFLNDIRTSIDAAKRVGAKWMTVFPGYADARTPYDRQMSHVVDGLKRAAELVEPHGLVMVIEPVNHYANHPGLFVTSADQAALLCDAVDSPSCKILYDVYHIQVQHGNLIDTMNAVWRHVAYIQFGDAPGRKEPGTGEINYANIMKRLTALGYEGLIGMEHGFSQAGAAGEEQVIDVYRALDQHA